MVTNAQHNRIVIAVTAATVLLLAIAIALLTSRTAVSANGGGEEGGVEVGPCEPILLTFDDFDTGTVLKEQLAEDGIHMAAYAFGGRPHKLITFDSNATGTPDWDLEVDLGQIAIIPENVTDADENGLVDVPNDSAAGGKQIFEFNHARTVQSFTMIDLDHEGEHWAKAYNGEGGVIKTVWMEPSGDHTYQTIEVNAEGVRKLVIHYPDSGAVDNIELGCTSEPAGEPTPTDEPHEPTPTPSPSPTPTPTPSPTPTPTPTPTATPTPTPTPTPSPTPTPTPSPSPTPTPTPSPTPTPTPSPTPTTPPSPTPTPVPVADLQVTLAQMNGPSQADLGQQFAISIDGRVVNNGPAFTTQGNVTFNLTEPPGCTKSPSGTQTVTNIDLPQGVSVFVSGPSWTVSCSVGGQLQFAARVTANPSSPNVTDPTSFNNFRTALMNIFIVDPNAASVFTSTADADCDGSLNATDALLVIKFSAGKGTLPDGGCGTAASALDVSAAEDAMRKPGDLNCDGKVNVLDALAVLRWVAGFEVQTGVRNCFGFA